MADNIRFRKKSFSDINPMYQKIQDMASMAHTRRRKFEQRWYDNNFFDDGHHFRYVNRTTGKIADLSTHAGLNLPMRAIPKASRQVRGVANLLLSADYNPVVYPEKVERSNFMKQQEIVDPNTGVPTTQMVLDEEQFLIAKNASKLLAQRVGHWITEEWKEQDILNKLIEMVILTTKHSVSFMQVWPDALSEDIKTEVYDAFDILLLGSYKNISDVPFIIKETPWLTEDIKGNELFDEQKRGSVLADNKLSGSETKQAYLQSVFGTGMDVDSANTAIVREAFIKERLSANNMEHVAKFKDVIANKKMGDTVMRHIFTGGGVDLLDEYIDLPDYPFIDLRFEPGALYQKPFIENFIPANKSLDIAVSRIERWMNTMVTGHWLSRKGENISISNIPGGQKLEYEGTPPVQGNIVGLPNTVFNFTDFLERVMEEQGASTSALGQLPSGVKSGVAIESLKATEYANLKIPSEQLKKALKDITKKMINIADNYFTDPVTVELMEKGEPNYFDIIGNKGVEKRKELGIDIPDAIVIKDSVRVDIEIESGLGFTQQGRRESIQQISDYMLNLAREGHIPPEAIKVITRELLETFKFGATQDIMSALDDVDSNQLTEQQIQQMKIAIAEVLEDLGIAGTDAEEKQVQTTKVGILEALEDVGGVNNG